MTNNCPLENNTISDLLSLSVESSQELEINTTLQIVQIKKSEPKGTSSHKENYILTLRDLNVKYGGFIFSKEQSDLILKEKDILNITKVIIKVVSNKKIFFIRQLNVLSQFEGVDFNLKEVPFYKEHQPEKETILIKEDPEDMKSYTPLKQLTTFSRDFIICARVTQKTEMKHFSNTSNSNGRLFSFDILDKEGTEMQVTCFNKVADKFYEKIEKDSIYEIIGGYIKLNNKKYSSNTGEYKIVLDEKAEITKLDDDGKIKKDNVKLVTIEDIPKFELYAVVDVCGTILEIRDKVKRNTKSGEQILRKIVIGDYSKYKIELTLWKHNADINFSKGDIIYVHHVKIGDFNGRFLSSIDSTIIDINPLIDEVENMKKFMNSYNNEYSTLDKCINNTEKNENIFDDFFFLKDLLDDNFHMDNNKNALLKATITKLINNEKNYYLGCPNVNCKKKLTKKDNGDDYFCPGCNTDVIEPAYYYSLNLKVQDSTTEYWIDLFGKTAENLLNISAEDYKNYVIEKNSTKLKEIADNIEFKEYVFYVKPKTQTYAGNIKKRIYAFRVEPVDNSYYNRISKTILNRLNNY